MIKDDRDESNRGIPTKTMFEVLPSLEELAFFSKSRYSYVRYSKSEETLHRRPCFPCFVRSARSLCAYNPTVGHLTFPPAKRIVIQVQPVSASRQDGSSADECLTSLLECLVTGQGQLPC